MRSPNVDHRHSLLLILAPIKAGAESALAQYLQSLGPISPFARLLRTHVGRLIVLDELPQDPGSEPDRLDQPYLLLTSVFDGDVATYLDELCAEWTTEAREIWGRCIGVSDSPTTAELRGYLEHNRLNTDYFFSAYRDATTDQVLRALDKRERLVAFAIAAQSMQPSARREFFLREFG